VLAFQGAEQLRRFGGEIFTVNLVAVSFLREICILLTAIIVAGRSGSAFTAQIGSMKLREEIDAMRTLGLDPMEVLVLPRVISLLIMLPILGFISGMMGLFGGGLVVWMELGMSPAMYIERVKDAVDVWRSKVARSRSVSGQLPRSSRASSPSLSSTRSSPSCS
jgi:phospholipid/cholesterol/gamma-HCH transport system permease protein